MISFTGNSLLILSLSCALLAIIFKGRARLSCFYIASISPLTAMFVLIYAFIISDFSLRNVFFNSSVLLPTIYKISASWASHEGSMLLWYALLSIASFAYIYMAKFSIGAKEFGAMILSFIQLLFCSFIIFTSNPFDPLSFVPSEGLGLNPMLQDMALSIHPPLLYMGLVSYVTLFAGGILLLCRPLEKKEILQINKTFSSFALMALTSGIGLGAWWAYRELGWGGYWFFDPVENISLLPWLSAITLHHFMLLSMRNDQYLSCTIFLSLLCFLLTIYGTFIVRSGIISSVHAFAFSPERGLYIFYICAVLTVLSMGLFFWKQSSVPVMPAKYNSQSYSILFGNILWLVALFSLIISLIYPIYCSFVDGADIVIDPEYFKKVYLPIHIPILILAAIAPRLFRISYNRQITIIIISMIISVGLIAELSITAMAGIFCAVAIYLIIQVCDYLIVKSEYFSKNVAIKTYALFLGHFGFGVLVLSIALNTSMSHEIEFVGKVGQKVKNKNLAVKLENIKFTDGENYFRQIAEFSVEDQNNNITILQPENRLYKIENTLSQEVDIYSFLFHDVYAVLSQIDKKKTVHAKIYYQPFISFIWFSVFLMSSGFMLLLFRESSVALKKESK
jgi:cytochrome c-type biogenesis protein CcmF